MYIEINEELLQKVTNITNFTYKSKGDFIAYEDIISIIEDLITEYDVLQEKYEDFKQEVEDNFKPLTNKELYD